MASGGGKGASAAARAEEEGLAGPHDAAVAAPHATLSQQAAQGVLSVFDAVSGRDAHLALCTSEAVAALVAVGLADAWRQ